MSFKNCVLEGSWVDFGASRPRFWSLQASILEPPGLDFGASSLDFEASRLDCGASRPPTFLCLCFPHSATPLGKRGTVSCLGFIPFVFLPSSTALPKCGRRRCPPLGAFNPPPTEGVRSVRDHQPHRFQIRSTHHSSRI